MSVPPGLTIRSIINTFVLCSLCKTTAALTSLTGRVLISIYIGCLFLERLDDSNLTLICFSTFVVSQLLEFTYLWCAYRVMVV